MSNLSFEQVEFLMELISDLVCTNGEVSYHYHNDKSNREILTYPEIEKLWLQLQEHKLKIADIV